MLDEFRKLVGEVNTDGTPLRPRSELVLTAEKYKAYRVMLDVVEGVELYGILLVPGGVAGRAPAVICQHGLSGTPEMVVGLGQREDTAYHEFGRRLAERGYVVFAPLFSPAFYRTHILPKEKAVVAGFSKPLITHSDGNMTPLLDDWLELGQQAIHPIQPDVMDIQRAKQKYGKQTALVGNVSMSDLVNGTPQFIAAEVRKLIQNIGRGGGYIISSSNSLTDDMKPENVPAIRDTIASQKLPGTMCRV